MFKSTLVMFCLILQSCTSDLSKPDTAEGRYISDASNCSHTSQHKAKVKVPIRAALRGGESIAIGNIDIDIPLAKNTEAYSLCMKQAGHPEITPNAEDYHRVSRACIQEARTSSNFDVAYANCVKLGYITVETIESEK
jgi:hypothetical protein